MNNLRFNSQSKRTFVNIVLGSVLALFVFSAALVVGHNPSQYPVVVGHVYQHPNSLCLCQTTSEVTRNVGLDAKVLKASESRTTWGLGCVASRLPLGSHLDWHFVTDPSPSQTSHSIRACALTNKHMVALDFEVEHNVVSKPGWFPWTTNTTWYVRGTYTKYDCWTNAELDEE